MDQVLVSIGDGDHGADINDLYGVEDLDVLSLVIHPYTRNLENLDGNLSVWCFKRKNNHDM